MTSSIAGGFALPARATALRFLILIFAPGFMFGNYYFFDQTSATQAAIIKQTGMDEVMFGVLSSVYSIPNMILPLIGGVLIDRLGTRASCIGFSALVLSGSIVFSFGLQFEATWMLVLGRIIFGMGGESQNVACLTVISRWFVGRELAFAMAICIAVSRLGSVAAFNTQPQLVSATDVVWASFCGSAICVASLGSSVVVAMVDKFGEKRDSARGLLSTDDDGPAGDGPVQLADTLKFGPAFWLTSICCVSVYVAAFPFLQVTSVPFLEERFHWDEKGANAVTSLPNLVSAFASPAFGLVVDRFGHRPPLIVLSSLLFLGCYIGFIVIPGSYQPDFIKVLYALLGVALSLFGSVIWPCVPLVVEAKAVGTAIGLCTALQNFGMAVSPTVLTALTKSGGLTGAFVYVVACIFLGLIAACALWVLDLRGDRKLSKGQS